MFKYKKEISSEKYQVNEKVLSVGRDLETLFSVFADDVQ